MLFDYNYGILIMLHCTLNFNRQLRVISVNNSFFNLIIHKFEIDINNLS